MLHRKKLTPNADFFADKKCQRSSHKGLYLSLPKWEQAVCAQCKLQLQYVCKVVSLLSISLSYVVPVHIVYKINLNKNWLYVITFSSKLIHFILIPLKFISLSQNIKQKNPVWVTFCENYTLLDHHCVKKNK